MPSFLVARGTYVRRGPPAEGTYSEFNGYPRGLKQIETVARRAYVTQRRARLPFISVFFFLFLVKYLFERTSPQVKEERLLVRGLRAFVPSAPEGL